MKNKPKQDDGVRVKSTPPFKLKDRPQRSFQAINLQLQFGFIPEVIIVEKMAGHNNTIIVRAVLTQEEMKKEDTRIAKLSKEEKERLGIETKKEVKHG